MTYEQWIARAAITKPKAQRYGQWLFNSLYSVRPDIANRIRTSINDPFYQDNRVPAFLEAVAKEWK